MEKGSIGVGMRILDSDERLKKVPDEFKEIAKDFAEKGFITTSFDNLGSFGFINIFSFSNPCNINPFSSFGYRYSCMNRIF